MLGWGLVGLVAGWMPGLLRNRLDRDEELAAS